MASYIPDGLLDKANFADLTAGVQRIGAVPDQCRRDRRPSTAELLDIVVFLIIQTHSFASPEIYEYLEAQGFLSAIRLPANKVLRESIAHLLTRPVGRPPEHVRRTDASFSYRAGNWSKKRRVVAKVEWYPGELCPHGLDPLRGSSVSNLSRPAERVDQFHNQCGTAEQWIEEGKYAINWTRLSCHSFRNNAVRVKLRALAYNLANFMRTLVLPNEIGHWSFTMPREKLIKIGAKVVRHGRYVTFQMAEVAVPGNLFGEILRRIDGFRRTAPAVA